MYSYPLSLSLIFNGGLGGTIFSFLTGAAAGAWAGCSAILVRLLFLGLVTLRLTGAERVEDGCRGGYLGYIRVISWIRRWIATMDVKGKSTYTGNGPRSSC